MCGPRTVLYFQLGENTNSGAILQQFFQSRLIHGRIGMDKSAGRILTQRISIEEPLYFAHGFSS
jgi:hypothetical protein